MERLYVDRIIHGIAVCEDDDFNRTEIRLKDLGFEIHEGSVLVRGENGKYSPDESEEEKRRREVLELQKKLMGQ